MQFFFFLGIIGVPREGRGRGSREQGSKAVGTMEKALQDMVSLNQLSLFQEYRKYVVGEPQDKP